MSRHTSPNRKRIDDAYPVRVKIRIPRNGLGNLFGEIHAWLMALGPGRAANQSTRGLYCDATAYYFRDLADAEPFLAAFPMLELADGVEQARL